MTLTIAAVARCQHACCFKTDHMLAHPGYTVAQSPYFEGVMTAGSGKCTHQCKRTALNQVTQPQQRPGDIHKHLGSVPSAHQGGHTQYTARYHMGQLPQQLRQLHLVRRQLQGRRRLCCARVHAARQVKLPRLQHFQRFPAPMQQQDVCRMLCSVQLHAPMCREQQDSLLFSCHEGTIS